MKLISYTMATSSKPKECATVEVNNLYLCNEPAAQTKSCPEYLPLSFLFRISYSLRISYLVATLQNSFQLGILKWPTSFISF